jgi:ABC-type arginine/histidine transport system permease subunit
MDMVLMSTSVISTLGVLELTGAGRNIIATDMQVVTVYCAIALLYLGVSSLLNMTFGFIERGVRYDAR